MIRMCGRSSITKTEEELEERFGAKFYSKKVERFNPLPLYNIGPSMLVPIIKDNSPDEIVWAKWGFLPSWAKDLKATPPQINARKESVLERPYFKNAIQSSRCLVLLDGYFEWKTVGKSTKIPYYIHLKSKEAFAVAGIWEVFKSGETEITTFGLLTQTPNEALSTVHDRMPGILEKSQEKKWINKSKKAEVLVSDIKPYPENEIEFYTVSNKLNSSFDNNPDFILPKPYTGVIEQSSLF